MPVIAMRNHLKQRSRATAQYCAAAVAVSLAVGVAAVGAAAPAAVTPAPATPIPLGPGLVPAGMMSALAATGDRTVKATSALVRQSDLSHVIGVLYRTDHMYVERYAHKTTNPNAVYAVGTAHTRQGDVYGYVVYNGDLFY